MITWTEDSDRCPCLCPPPVLVIEVAWIHAEGGYYTPPGGPGPPTWVDALARANGAAFPAYGMETTVALDNTSTTGAEGPINVPIVGPTAQALVQGYVGADPMDPSFTDTGDVTRAKIRLSYTSDGNDVILRTRIVTATETALPQEYVFGDETDTPSSGTSGDTIVLLEVEIPVPTQAGHEEIFSYMDGGLIRDAGLLTASFLSFNVNKARGSLGKFGFHAYQEEGVSAPAIYLSEIMSGKWSGSQFYTIDDSGNATLSPFDGPDEALPYISAPFPSFSPPVPGLNEDTATQRKIKLTPTEAQLNLSLEYLTADLRSRLESVVNAAISGGSFSTGQPAAIKVLATGEAFYVFGLCKWTITASAFELYVASVTDGGPTSVDITVKYQSLTRNYPGSEATADETKTVTLLRTGVDPSTGLDVWEGTTDSTDLNAGEGTEASFVGLKLDTVPNSSRALILEYAS